MALTYRDLDAINYPAFLLPSDNWSLVDGLLTVDNYIVDDQNMPGKTLGIRRMMTPFRKSLLPLHKGVMEPRGVVKQVSGPYIANDGRVFTYLKTRVVHLVFKRISKVEQREVASLLWVEGLKKPFTLPRPPPHDVKWAGILYIQGFPWMLYEYSVERPKDARRKI